MAPAPPAAPPPSGEDGPSKTSPKSAPATPRDKAVAKWQRAGGKAVALNRMGIVAGGPAKMLKGADAYAVDLKPGTLAGGVVTVLALIAAAAYTAVQIRDAVQRPPTIESHTEWSDTQGPFPMRVRCLAASGCLVSNRHNDSFSSHGDEVQQRSCLELAQAAEAWLNITFTQNPLNGLSVVWDPASAVPAGAPPSAGFAIAADTNCPPSACPSGVYNLFTPILAGSYLVNYVVTENTTSDAAPLRREWFATFVASQPQVNPAATMCADRLTPQQISTYSQASVRIMSAWYKVSVFKEDFWLTLWGNCGGALQLCLQIGAIFLMALDISLRLFPVYKSRVVAFVSGSGGGGNGGGGAGTLAAERPPQTPRAARGGTAAAKAAPQHQQAAGRAAGRPSVVVPRGLVDELVLGSVSGSGAASVTPHVHAGPGAAGGWAGPPSSVGSAGHTPAAAGRGGGGGGGGAGRPRPAKPESASLPAWRRSTSSGDRGGVTGGGAAAPGMLLSLSGAGDAVVTATAAKGSGGAKK